MFALVSKNTKGNRELCVVSTTRICRTSGPNVRVKWGKHWYLAKILAESDDILWLKTLHLDADGNMTGGDRVVDAPRQAGEGGITDFMKSGVSENAADNATTSHAFSANVTMSHDTAHNGTDEDDSSGNDAGCSIAKASEDSLNENFIVTTSSNDPDAGCPNATTTTHDSDDDDFIAKTTSDDANAQNSIHGDTSDVPEHNVTSNVSPDRPTDKTLKNDPIIADKNISGNAVDDKTNDGSTIEDTPNDESNDEATAPTDTSGNEIHDGDAVDNVIANAAADNDDEEGANNANKGDQEGPNNADEGDGMVELIPGSQVFISAIDLFDIRKRFTSNAREMTRRIMRSIIGVQSLASMTPAGRGRFKPIPVAVLEATERFVFRNVADGKKLDHAEYMRCLTLMCGNLRVKKQ